MTKRKIERDERNERVWTIEDPSERKFLRTRVPEFDVQAYDRKSIDNLAKDMRKIMVRMRGVGLSANQLGLRVRMFVAQLPNKDGKGYSGKFYAILNPSIESRSSKKTVDEEGCLSVPGLYGTVERLEKIVISGMDKQGRPVRIPAEGYLARIFQHEVDHLDGKLFIERAEEIFKIEKK